MSELKENISHAQARLYAILKEEALIAELPEVRKGWEALIGQYEKRLAQTTEALGVARTELQGLEARLAAAKRELGLREAQEENWLAA